MIRPFLLLVGALTVGAGCASSPPPVSSYGPPPPVTEPTPSRSEELRLIVGDDMTVQEQEDLAAMRLVRYDAPPDAKPQPLGTGLAELLEQEGARLVNERIGYDIPIVLNDRVNWWIDYFSHRMRDSFARYLARSSAWLPYVQRELGEAGMPEDLAYLVLIESGFSTSARSRVGAVGPWQFMPYTGREYGLRIDRWVDDRRDYERSTAAAVAYLQDLHALFGSWYLAAAGFNGGQGRVGRSMLRDNTVNFWELTGLRRETRNYVPKLIAATIIAKQPEKYGFTDIRGLPAVRWETVVVPTTTDLDVIARAAETTVGQIRSLNPHLLRGRTPPGVSNYSVRIPVGRTGVFLERYAAIPPDGRTKTPREHVVRQGETVSGIAARYGVGTRELMRENGIRDPRRLRAGQLVLIPGGGVSPTSSAAGTSLARASGGTHIVRSGETLSQIASRYGVSVAAIQLLNRLTSDRIRIGQSLSIP